MSRKFIQRSLQLTDDDPRPREGKGQPVILQQAGASSPAPGLSSPPLSRCPGSLVVVVAGGGRSLSRGCRLLTCVSPVPPNRAPPALHWHVGVLQGGL